MWRSSDSRLVPLVYKAYRSSLLSAFFKKRGDAIGRASICSGKQNSGLAEIEQQAEETLRLK